MRTESNKCQGTSIKSLVHLNIAAFRGVNFLALDLCYLLLTSERRSR